MMDDCEKPITGMNRINLLDEVIPEWTIDIKHEDYYGRVSETWGAGEQLEALEHFTNFPDGGEILATKMVGSYGGKCFAVFDYKDFIFIWRDYFGTCNGCDGLDGKRNHEAYQYIKLTLTEGNTLQFWSLSHAKAYLERNKEEVVDYTWKDFPIELLVEAKQKL